MSLYKHLDSETMYEYQGLREMSVHIITSYNNVTLETLSRELPSPFKDYPDYTPLHALVTLHRHVGPTKFKRIVYDLGVMDALDFRVYLRKEIGPLTEVESIPKYPKPVNLDNPLEEE